MAVNAAVFCLAVCVGSVTNEAGMCGTSIYYIMSQHFCGIHG